MDSLAFKLIVRALHLFPGVVLVVGLLLGLLSACQAIANYTHHAVIDLSAHSAHQKGIR